MMTPQVVQLFIRFLYRLASLNKDYAVVMCRLGTKESLVKALDKHSTNLLLVTELRDLISDCEKYASLYKKMNTSVLAGCIQVGACRVAGPGDALENILASSPAVKS